MTLDSWLSRACSPQLPPPAKRSRTDEAANEMELSRPTSRSKSRSVLTPPPKFQRETAKSMLREQWPPEHLFGRRSMCAWYSSRGFYDPAFPYSLACLPDSAHALIGLETGDIHVVQCGSSELGLYDPSVGHATSVLQSPGAYRSPVRDVAALGNGRIVSASDSGIHCMDLESTGNSSLVGNVLDVANVSVHSKSRNIIAYGTSSGSVGIVDLRERVPKVTREWSDAHAVLAGPRAQRVRHGITAVNFCSEEIIATASNANECVKFWDVRATSRKQPVHATAPRSSTQPRTGGDGGIIALAGSITDPGRFLWGLNRSGDLLKIDAGSYYPQYRLSVPKLRVNSLYASIDLIPDSNSKLLKTGHRAPEWPFIACGGQNGVTLVSEPSDSAARLNVDACIASQLPCCEAANMTKVKWHPYTNELVTISEDNACRLWALRPSRKIPAQFLPDHDSSAAHRPRKVGVTMAPIAF